MNKILLALTLLSAGGGAFLIARQSMLQLQREADATSATRLAQTQLLAAAQTEQGSLSRRARELKEALAQASPAEENALWSAVQTNLSGHLPPELRERLLEELGLSWKSSEDFIVVSKETIHDVGMRTIQDGKLTGIASTVLALTPGERSQVEAVMQRGQTDFNDWARTHTERSEPTGDVVAEYTLHNDGTYLSVSNRFAAGLHEAVGRERAELILRMADDYLFATGIHKGDTTIMIVKRHLVGNEQRLKVEVFDTPGTPQQWPWATPQEVSRSSWFPSPFRPIFPNGWADVAKREGFELAEKAAEK
jgi:hypothetical protein